MFARNRLQFEYVLHINPKKHRVPRSKRLGYSYAIGRNAAGGVIQPKTELIFPENPIMFSSRIEISISDGGSYRTVYDIEIWDFSDEKSILLEIIMILFR